MATPNEQSLLLLNADLVAFAVRTVILAIREKEGHSGVATHDNSLSMPDWFEAGPRTDDVLDSFRQLPVFPEHRPLNARMCFDTRAKACCFATVKGGGFWSNFGCQCFLQVPHICGGTGTTRRCHPGHGIC